MNKLEIKNGYINVSLDVFSYRERGVRIMYSPALDLSGYGNTLDEAKRSFSSVLSEYLNYCVENNTLDADRDFFSEKFLKHLSKVASHFSKQRMRDPVKDSGHEIILDNKAG